jgi:hypothetical protein
MFRKAKGFHTKSICWNTQCEIMLSVQFMSSIWCKRTWQLRTVMQSLFLNDNMRIMNRLMSADMVIKECLQTSKSFPSITITNETSSVVHEQRDNNDSSDICWNAIVSILPRCKWVTLIRTQNVQNCSEWNHLDDRKVIILLFLR